MRFLSEKKFLRKSRLDNMVLNLKQVIVSL